METPLRLNVGGKEFLVSEATLTKYPSSILSDPNLVGLAKSTSPPFIDRDPDLFHHVLSFLRCEIPEYYEGPSHRPTRRRLAYESRHYKLDELEQALKPKTGKPAERPDIGVSPSKYLYVVCEKHLVYNDGVLKPVAGHFVIEGRCEGQRGWLGFSEEKMTQRFQMQVGARLQGYVNIGFEVKSMDSSTATQVCKEGTGESDQRQWCHITTTSFLLQRLS